MSPTRLKALVKRSEKLENRGHRIERLSQSPSARRPPPEVSVLRSVTDPGATRALPPTWRWPPGRSGPEGCTSIPGTTPSPSASPP